MPGTTRPLSPLSTRNGEENTPLNRIISFFAGASASSHSNPTAATRSDTHPPANNVRNDVNDITNWRAMLAEPLNNSFEATKKRKMLAIQANQLNNLIVPRSASIVDIPAGFVANPAIAKAISELNHLEGPSTSNSEPVVSAGISNRNSIADATSPTNFGPDFSLLTMPGGYLSLKSARKNQEDLVNDLEQRRRTIVDNIYYDEPTAGFSRQGSPMDGVLVHPPNPLPFPHSRSQSPTATLNTVPNPLHSHIYPRSTSLVVTRDQEEDEGSVSRFEPGNETFFRNNGNQSYGNLDIDIIEHEFAPLYRGSNGELVRPPFINLDPRERYELLQLKKSVEVANQLQSRIKYMVDPLETISKRVPNSTKVETSTQTSDLGTLSSSLNFVRKRKLERTFAQESKAKKQKNSRGYFVCDFDYEVVEKPKVEVKKKSLIGYLGEVQPPVISNDKLASKFDLNANGKLQLDEEYIKRNKELEAASTKAPISAPSLSFSSKPASSPSSLPSNTASSGSSAPSLFSTTTSADNSTFGNPKPSQSVTETDVEPKRKRTSNSTEKPSILFGATKNAESATPSFSFGSKPTSSSGSGDKKSTPLFGASSTGNDKSTSKAPAFLFGNSDNEKADAAISKPTLSFGTSTEKKKASLPSFSFGEKKDTPTSSIFGTTEKKENASKSTFAFGNPPGENKETSNKPTFSFDVKTEKRDDNTTKAPFAFGATTEKKDDTTVKPAFKFGASTSAEKEEEPKKGLFSIDSDKNSDSPSLIAAPTKPAFSFGATSEKKVETAQSFSFGNTTATKPSFSFGQKADDPAEVEENEGSKKRLHSSGSTERETSKSPFVIGGATEKNESLKPAFSIGASVSSKDESPKPAFSFGATASDKKDDSSKPAFSFGATASDKKDDSPKPAFSFGATASDKKDESPKPAFSFGATASDKKDDSSKPAFSFGSSSNLKPTFGFGGNAQKKDDSPKPAFSFGGAATAGSSTGSSPAPSSSGFSFGNTTKPSVTTPVSNSNVSKPTFNFDGSTKAPVFGGLPTTVGGDLSRSHSPAPTPFSFGAGGGNNETPKSANGGFSFGNSVNSSSVPNFGATAPTSFGASSNGFSASSTPGSFGNTQQQTTFGGFNNQNNNSGGGAFGLGSNPNSREVSPGFNFGQQLQPMQFGNPQLVPNINFSGGSTTSVDPSAIFSNTTPPPMGSVPVPRRRVAQPRQRRR